MWDKLSMAEKARIIALGVLSGITDLSSIRNRFDYNLWKERIKLHKGIDIDNDPSYDYEEFYRSNPNRAWDMMNKDSEAHFVDEFKTSLHPSFSNLSIYSGYKNKYNPKGITGGTWINNTNYLLSLSLFDNNWDTDETIDYFEKNERKHVNLYAPDGSTVLRGITVTPKPRKFDKGGYTKGVNYYNPITGLNYGDTMPEGMSRVRRFEDLTPLALDEYMANRSTLLDDLVVYPRSGKGAKSTNMGSYYDTINTLTELNRLHTEKVAMLDAFQKKANSINWQPVWNTIAKPFDIFKGVSNYISSDSKKPIAIDLANKEVKQVQNQRLASAVLGNEFVEHKNNTIRRARDYKVTKDTLLGDRNIKLSNISQFAGIENGKLKIGRLENFNDTTTIIPVRNKNIGRVTKIIKEKETYPDYNKMVDEKFPQIRSFKWMFMSPKKRKEYRDKKINYYNLLVRSKVPSPYNNYRVLLKAINEKGDTITLDNTFKHKMIFGDETGNSIFINKLLDDNTRDILNKRLSNTPLYPMILDNGRYSHYDLDGNVAGYVNPLDDRESMYIIGYKNGGKLNRIKEK